MTDIFKDIWRSAWTEIIARCCPWNSLVLIMQVNLLQSTGTWTDSPESVHSFPCYHAVLVFMPPCCLTMSVRFNALKVESLSVDITLMGHWKDNILGGLIGWYWEHDKVAAAACMATCGAVVNSYSHRSAPQHFTVWCGGAVVGLITTTLLLARPVSSSAVTVPFPLKTIVSSAQELHYWTSVDRDYIKWSRIMEQINIVWIVIIVCIHCPLSMCPIFFIHPPTIQFEEEVSIDIENQLECFTWITWNKQ